MGISNFRFRWFMVGHYIHGECERKRELKVSALGNGQVAESDLK